MRDYLYAGVRARGMLAKNETILEVKDHIGIITKKVEFCTSEKFLNELGSVDATIPFDLSDRDLNVIAALVVRVKGTPEYAYKDFEHSVEAAKLKKYDFTDVIIDEDKYTVPRDSEFLDELSKIYMPEFKKYIKLGNLKLV